MRVCYERVRVMRACVLCVLCACVCLCVRACMHVDECACMRMYVHARGHTTCTYIKTQIKL